MPLVFRTRADSPDDFHIVGVPGMAGPGGKGGIAVETAAETMPELQDKTGKPLVGKPLEKAAEEFASRYEQLEVKKESDKTVAGLPQELGSPPDRPHAVDVAVSNYQDIYGDASPEPSQGGLPLSPADSEKE